MDKGIAEIPIPAASRDTDTSFIPCGKNATKCIPASDPITSRMIVDPAEKTEALRVISEHLIPGRWAEVRGPSANELKATTVLEFLIEEVSAKVRAGPPLDNENGYALPVWAGVLPVELRTGLPVPDDRLVNGIALPAYVQRYDLRLEEGASISPPLTTTVGH